MSFEKAPSSIGYYVHNNENIALSLRDAIAQGYVDENIVGGVNRWLLTFVLLD